MHPLYLIAALLVLVFTTTSAVNHVRLGYPNWGFMQGLAPVLWVGICTALMIAVSRSKMRSPWRLGALTLLVTLSLVGAVFGFYAGLLMGISLSKGVGEARLGQEHLMYFVTGGALALPVGLIFAGVAIVVAHFTKQVRSSNQVSEEN